MIPFKRFHIVIKTIIEEYHFNIEEYQDKYYFKKKVQEFFPGITDGLIFSAINSFNSAYYCEGKEIPLQKLSKKLYDGILNSYEGRFE